MSLSGPNDRYCGASECPMLGVTRTPGNALHSHGCLCISAKNKPGKEKWSSLPHETEGLVVTDGAFLMLAGGREPSVKATACRATTRARNAVSLFPAG